jgi:hypothetical protein
MAKKDPRVDDYIKRAAPFARPILKHLRKIVHVGCPDVEETIKWQSPFFERKGIICFMAAFKQHCVFGFWKGSLIFGGIQGRDAAFRLDHFDARFAESENVNRLCLQSDGIERSRH